MNNIKVFSSFGLQLDLQHDKQIELYVDQIPVNQVPENTIRFVFLLEAIDFLDLNKEAIDGFNKGAYNFLLTHNEDLLKTIPNAHLFEFGSCWIGDYTFPNKTFSVSALVGGKTVTEGHKLRQKLWFKQNKITSVKSNFFLSGNLGGVENYNNNPILGDSKNPLFDSQFHICIEQGKRNNYFSEKLIDTLQTKTVPIYWGCPNIGNWFDTRGFIMVDNIKEVISACNSLSEDDYEKMLPYIEENYERSKEFVDLKTRLINKIENLL